MLAVVIPSYNAGDHWLQTCHSILRQVASIQVCLIIDSGSLDQTVPIARKLNFEVRSIHQSQFNHGGTRQFAAEILSDVDVIIYMTQDAILFDEFAINNLIEAFADPAVGMVYGRQLPHQSAKPIGRHARLFNYSEKSYVARLSDRESMGIKVAFSSNSFSAYRRRMLMDVGGFPSNVILGEDTIVAAKMLMAGWKVAYQADARVYHSHDYAYCQEFQRYFDIGVMHTRESWMLDAFGKPEGEGLRFVRSELAFLFKNAPWLIPSSILRTLLKYLGYRLGRIESRLPLRLKRYLSLHKGYWT